MAKVINLNHARKKRAKTEKAQQADRNRVLHGMSAAQRQQAEQRKLRDAQHLNRHQLAPAVEPGASEGPAATPDGSPSPHTGAPDKPPKPTGR